MKIRHFNIMRLLYCLVLALPFVAILSRVIYVQSNKNAYQSAEITQTYNKATTTQTNEVNTIDDLIVGNVYTFEQIGTGIGTPFVLITDFNFAENVFGYEFNNSVVNGPPSSKLSVYDNSQTIIQEMYMYSNDYVNDKERTIQFTFKLKNLPNTYVWSYGGTDILKISSAIYLPLIEEEVQNTTLDNVFEYSVNKFIDDNNFGRINLFQWTTNLFFDDKQVNNMYVHFVNWYLNYVLLMSTTYILFLVLMWFVNYSRRLLERGMNYDW